MKPDREKQRTLSTGGGAAAASQDLPPGIEFQSTEPGKKSGLFGRFNRKFQETLENSRGDDSVFETTPEPDLPSSDLAPRRARGQNGKRMVVPEGVVIEGSLSSASETEIAGQVNGDVTVDTKLYLGKSACIKGNVRTATCKVDGIVEGKIDCSQELQLGESGELHSDALASKKMTLAGKVAGNVSCGGVLRLVASARVTGNIRARTIVIEEGATFNGQCAMTSAKRKE